VQFFQVGGAIRDELLGIGGGDTDWVVVGATPEEMIRLGYLPVGRQFPVFLHPQTKEEYALARTERKVAPGYRGFTFCTDPTVTLESDLRRRDLTINAIARDEHGRYIDPFGGIADLKARRLRHVSPAFAEDPVRILRVARFMARFKHLGFQVAEETIAFMREMVRRGEADALVPERVWKETVRALAETTPEAYFETLRECGALQVIFPEIDRLFGVPQRPDHHPEIDTGIHTFMVLHEAAKLSAEPRVRFAALLHDLGKGTTPAILLPGHHGHEHRSVALIRTLCRRLRTPNAFRDLAELTAQHHCNVHRALELRPSTLLKMLQCTDAFRRPRRFKEMLLACEADYRGRKGFEDRPYPQAERLWNAYRAAAGVDIRPLLQSGLRGQALQQAIRQKRLEALRC